LTRFLLTAFFFTILVGCTCDAADVRSVLSINFWVFQNDPAHISTDLFGLLESAPVQ
jgi:hypothetical protein